MTAPTLRNYQTDVLERARWRLRKGAKRVIIQGETGSGKGTCLAELVRCADAKGKFVLVLVHRRSLVAMLGQRLAQFSVEHGILMAGEAGNKHVFVQVASKDTVMARSFRDHNPLPLPPADLVIVDEARHSLASEYQTLLKAYPKATVVGFDATPCRADGRGLGSYYDALECMVPTSQLVREGHLVPVRCFAPERLSKHRKQGVPVKGLAGDPVYWWHKYAEGRPTVAFADRVSSSIALADRFNQDGVPAAHIDADTPDEVRDDVTDRLRAGLLKVVVNVGLVTEGVDIPELGCCILACKCGTYPGYKQRVGRILRPFLDKKDAVILDHSGAIASHGFPTDDVEWTLDADDSVDRRNQEAKKKKGDGEGVMVCPQCAFLFSGQPACPQCGTVLKKKVKPKDAQRHNEPLIELFPEEAAARQQIGRERHWLYALRVGAVKGWRAKQAMAMYHARFKQWPDPSLPMHVGFDQRNDFITDLFPSILQRKGPNP